MTDQVFELDNFRGPLDLLLHLIREQELEITEIDLSQLCDQYLAAIEAMKAVDINVAGEFLVMAATLILIKSRTLLPREEEVDLEEELDPGDELIQQLLEYRKYKTLSMELGRRAEERSLRTGRGMKELPPDEENELETIDLWDLVGSYVRLMEELGLERRFDTLRNEKPLRAFLHETLTALSSRSHWTLRDLVVHHGKQPGSVFGFFLSLLELVKSRQVRIVRDGRKDHEGEIAVELREDRDESRLSFLFDGPEGAQAELADSEQPDGEQPDAKLTGAEQPAAELPAAERDDALQTDAEQPEARAKPPAPEAPGAGEANELGGDGEANESGAIGANGGASDGSGVGQAMEASEASAGSAPAEAASLDGASPPEVEPERPGRAEA